ncbi:carboxylesterase/lipase family protein [Antarctobacter sp.]|uniref:carboxylesterase/lipase family protein n=1 Tax=Antarctobacter sp. TaxID=1872577 RepID=UPI003A8EB58F
MSQRPWEVETQAGRYRGAPVGGACVFRGIRYGRAHRFQAPVAADPFVGIRDADRSGPASPQRIGAGQSDPFLSWYSDVGAMSEDCQFLDVFTPGCDGTARPVMVWLHGGGWMSFSGSSDGTDGTALAQAQDVVVVSLSHRLGAFGFLALDTEDARFADAGNAGLLDIALALRWVRDNIAAFGGDPGNVTIFGQSGGAAKVAALMAMPAAEGLFHKAIIQSMSGGLQIARPEEAARISHALTRAAGLEPGDTEGLCSLSEMQLVEAQSTLPRVFRPVIDGRQFTGHPLLPMAPARSRHIPLMAGCTATETTYYMRAQPDSFGIDTDSLHRRLVRFLGTDAAKTARIVQAYCDAQPGATPTDILVAVTTDQIFMRNTYHAAQLQADAGAPVFAFVYARETPVEGGRLGAPHCSEVPFIFGTADRAAAHVGEGPDIAPMTGMMMATWAAFARSGTPANPLLPEWRPFAHPDRPVMALQPHPRLLSAPGAIARAALNDVPRYEYAMARGSFTTD